MNASRLALSALSLSLLCAAALPGCVADDDDTEAPASAPAAARGGYGFEMLPETVSRERSSTAFAWPDEVFARLSPELVRDVVRDGFDDLKACDRTPGGGRREVTVRFVIDPSGGVKSVKTERARGLAPATETCVRDAVSGLLFPRSHGGDAEVVYPLAF